MITIPIAVHNEFFKWQLDLFWYNHKLIYGDEAYNKAIAIIIKRNTSKETKPETISWNLDIPKKLCDSYFDYLNINENGYLLPLNIQVGLLQILNEIDDNETIELTDCDMFHIKKYENVEIKEDEFYVCDIYEKWHLLSTNENKHVVQKYLNTNTILYNGGFVPIIGLCKTFKKIIDDWISIHKSMVLNDNHEHLIKWWSGMYSFQAACQNNNVKMISKDYCYVPEINSISEFHHIAHYSVDKLFNKTLFPKINSANFLNNHYYKTIKFWYNNSQWKSKMIQPKRRCWEGIHPYHPHDYTAGLINLCKEFITKNMIGVEIGSFRGASSEVFSYFCKKITCVDPWSLAQEKRDYNEIKLSLSIKAEIEFDEVLKNNENIFKVKLFSDEAINLFDENSLDFVYIDAAHDSYNFELDFNLWKTKVKNGGYICGHDHDMIQSSIKKLNIDIIKTYEDSSWISINK